MSPLPETDGHDFPGFVDEVVPRFAAVGDDVFMRCEDSVGEPVVAHELPGVLHRV